MLRKSVGGRPKGSEGNEPSKEDGGRRETQSRSSPP